VNALSFAGGQTRSPRLDRRSGLVLQCRALLWATISLIFSPGCTFLHQENNNLRLFLRKRILWTGEHSYFLTDGFFLESLLVVRYLHLDLSKHVMRNISRFRLRVHTLKVEAAAWHEERWFLRMWPMSWWRWTCSERGACSFNLPRPSSLWAEETLFLSVFTFFWGLFSSPTLFAATGQQPANLFMISFLSRTLDFFFFFLSLWIYLWLAETSQQPISQTTWLKVTPHCNHCNHCLLFSSFCGDGGNQQYSIWTAWGKFVVFNQGGSFL